MQKAYKAAKEAEDALMHERERQEAIRAAFAADKKALGERVDLLEQKLQVK